MKKDGAAPDGKDNAPKKKEQKIIYIDDGSTIADMSGTRKGAPPRKKSTMKEKWHTYITTVKHMILPLLVTLLAMTMVFVLLMLLTGQWT